MNSCIKCGKPIADGELFCSVCSMNDVPSVPRRPAAEPVGRMQKPVKKSAPRHEPTSKPEKTQVPQSGRRGPVVTLAILFVLSFGLLLWQVASRQSQAVKLRLRQDELDARETALSDLEEENAANAALLEQTSAELEETTQQLDALQTQLDDAQRSVTQSEYDKTTQQTELDETKSQLEDLQSSYDTLQESYDSMSEKQEALEEANAELTKKSTFMDKYVVFVDNDGSNLYHRYSCSHFKAESFWAYSKHLAEKHGYEPCPYCN